MNCLLRLRVCTLLICFAFPVAAAADVRFNTDTPSMARRITITAFDRAGNAFPIVIDLGPGIVGRMDAAQRKASAIVSEITAASAGVPLNPANNRYTRQNPFPFTAEQRFAGNPPRPDTLVTIKGTRRIQIGPDNTGEALDKIGPQGNGILTSLVFGGSGAASGEDTAGGSSVVNLGIEGDYIASAFPS